MYRQWIVALVSSATMLIACSDKKGALSSIEDDKHIPTMSIDSLHIIYTEGGHLRMMLEAPIMQRFMLAEEPFSEFKDGIHIYFYTITKELESEIKANYAINKEKPEELWKAVGDVVIINYTKQQTLYTDTLYWNRVQKTIYTSAPVRILTPDGDIKGRYGMTSDERFENYEIRSIKDSQIYVNDTPESQDSTAVGTNPTPGASHTAVPVAPNSVIHEATRTEFHPKKTQ